MHRSLRYATALIIAQGAAILASTAAHAQDNVRTPIADTYVESTMPDTNFGASEELAAGKGSFWGLGFARTYLKFDLSDLTDPDAIESATLRVFQHRTEPAAGGLGDDVFALLGDWDESTITWNNKPANGTRAGNVSSRVGDSFARGWLDYDVTELLKAIAAGGPNNGFAVAQLTEISAGASRYGYFHSRESADPDLHPQLVVVLTETCPADLDGDGELTIFDFLEFQNLFAAMDPRADFDGDGEFTLFDFLAFQNEFAAGCD